jgi:hypothetical protein
MSSAVQLGTAFYLGYTMLRLQAPVVTIVVTVALTALASNQLSSALQNLLEPYGLDKISAKIWERTAELPCQLVASTAAWKLAQLALAYLTKVVPPAIPKLLLIAASISALAIAYYRMDAVSTNKKHADAIRKLNAEFRIAPMTIKHPSDKLLSSDALIPKIKTDLLPCAEILTREIGKECIIQRVWIGLMYGSVFIAVKNDGTEQRIASCAISISSNKSEDNNLPSSQTDTLKFTQFDLIPGV